MKRQTLLQLCNLLAAGTLLAGHGLADYIYIADNRGVTEYSTTGGSNQTGELVTSQGFSGLAVNSSGSLYGVNSQIYSIGNGGSLDELTSFSSTNALPSWNGNVGFAINSSGDFLIGQSFTNSVTEVTPGLVKSTVGNFQGINFATAVEVDGSGNVFFTAAQEIYEIPAGGSAKTIGSGFTNVTGMAIDASGDVFANDDGKIDEIVAGSNTVTQFANLGASGGGSMSFDSAGDLFVENSDKLYEFASGSDTATLIASNLAYSYSNSFIAISDENLVGTPEPGTWLTMLAGAALLTFSRLKGRHQA